MDVCPNAKKHKIVVQKLFIVISVITGFILNDPM